MTYDPSLGYDPRGYFAVGTSHVELQHCLRCGAVVADCATHDRWHGGGAP